MREVDARHLHGIICGQRKPLRMSVMKSPADTTALNAPWSSVEYDLWQRVQNEKDAAECEAENIRILQRFDPETETAVRALEEGWGRSSHGRT